VTGGDRFSPWGSADGWRLNLAAAPQTLLFRCGAEEWAVSASPITRRHDGGPHDRRHGAEWRLSVGDWVCAASAERGPGGRLAAVLDGVRRAVRVLEHPLEAGLEQGLEQGAALAVFFGGESWQLVEVDPLAPPAGADVTAGRLIAPMPGRVVQLLVAAGEQVRQGQPMIVVEAMKMEHTIAAPRDGIVAAVHYAPGDVVEDGAELIALEPSEPAPAAAAEPPAGSRERG
jgi:3-methylcrotonyl-CoA carboxylase alpha subunit